MIFTLKNPRRQPVLIQLTHRVAGGRFKSRSEVTTRIDHDAKGNAHPRRVRLRHPPVLRVRSGEEVDVPMSVMHDPEVKKALQAGRLKVTRKESETEWRSRKLAENNAAARAPHEAELKAKRHAEALAQSKARRKQRDAATATKLSTKLKPSGKPSKSKDGQE